ncbi:MAG: hypothetical protein ABFR05_01695 [Bacteroidota bacterium]
MNALQLKNSIIQKLTQIDDVNTLGKIHDLIQSYHVISKERTPFLSDNKSDENNDAEDFTDYIKEWVKDM